MMGVVLSPSDLEELIKSRRTIHKYKAEPVDKELIIKAIECAQFAPNHKHTHPTRFYLVGKEKREEVCEIIAPKNECSDIQREKAEKLYLGCAHLIVITNIKETNPFIAKENYATLAMAIQNIKLYLWQHGIGTKWSSGPILKSQNAYDIFDLDPNEEIIEAFLWAGVPEFIPPTPQRPDLHNVFVEI